MAAMANGMRCTYIDPRASITACKATRYWQVRPNSDYALNLAIIHEVLKQEAYDKDFVARFVSGMDYPARGGQGHDAGMAGNPYRRSGRPASRLRQGDRRRGAARDLPPRLDDGASQAVVLRQPHGADPERADGQHRDPGRVRDGEAARVLRPQGPEAARPTACPRSTSRASTAPAPRGRSWDPAIGMVHQAFAAMETGKPYGIGAYFAYRHDPITGHARPRGDSNGRWTS